MYHMDTDKAYRGKARQNLHKKAMSYIGQIFEATFPQNSNCTATYLPSLKPSK